MKRLYILIILVCLIMFIGPKNTVHAYIGLCCGKCGGNMPMNIPGGGVPETNEFRVKLSPMWMSMKGLRDGIHGVSDNTLLGMPSMKKFMAVPTSMDMYMVNLSIGYSFTDDLFGGLMFMWKKLSMDMKFNSMMHSSTGRSSYTMKSEGMGDTMLMVKYRLYANDPLIPTKEYSLFFGLNLPTGSISEKNTTHPVEERRKELLPYGMQLGSGTFDPTIGILYQGSRSPFWWGTNLTYTYRFYDNPRGYHLGNEFHYDLYGMYQFRYDMLTEIQINGTWWGRIKGSMDEFKNGDSGWAKDGSGNKVYPMSPLWITDNYGGHRISLSAGFQWQPFPLHIVDILFTIPLYQQINGPQLEEDYRIMFTYYVEIPTPSSIRYTGKEKQGRSRLGF